MTLLLRARLRAVHEHREDHHNRADSLTRRSVVASVGLIPAGRPLSLGARTRQHHWFARPGSALRGAATASLCGDLRASVRRDHGDGNRRRATHHLLSGGAADPGVAGRAFVRRSTPGCYTPAAASAAWIPSTAELMMPPAAPLPSPAIQTPGIEATSPEASRTTRTAAEVVVSIPRISPVS